MRNARGGVLGKNLASGGAEWALFQESFRIKDSRPDLFTFRPCYSTEATRPLSSFRIGLPLAPF
jgi:hypothetical protein